MTVKNLHTNDSAIFDMPEVIDIGLKSASIDKGGRILGIGTTLASFHWEGTIPCLIEELIIAQIGAASMYPPFPQLFHC